jgi:cell division septation protein DedD
MAGANQGRGRAYQPDVGDRPVPMPQADGRMSYHAWLGLFVAIIVGGLGFVAWLMGSQDTGDLDVMTLEPEAKEFKVAYDGPQPKSADAPSPTLDSVLEGRPQMLDEAVVLTPAAGEPKAKPAPKPAAKADEGKFVTQIAALRSNEAAVQAWRRLSQKSPDLFATVKQDIQVADLGEKGLYHRLRAGYFQDRAAANRFCDGVRELGQECLVMTR